MKKGLPAKRFLGLVLASLLLLAAAPAAMAAQPEWLADAQYDDAWRFSEGLARVLLDGKYGYLAADGTMAISPRYDNATDFGSGVAWVLENGQWSIIDAKGGVVFTLTNKRFTFAVDDVPSAFEDGLSILHGTGNVTSVAACSLVYTPYGDLAFSAPGYLQGFHDGISWSFLPGANAPLGFVDRNGRFTYTSEAKTAYIDYLYSAVKPFSGGFAAVCDRASQTWTFIDKTGKRPFSLDCESVSYFSEGMAPVCLNGLWGYLNDKGSMVIKPQFSLAFPINEGLGLVVQDGKARLIDTAGQFVTDAQFDSFYYMGRQVGSALIPETYFSDARAKIQNDGLYGFADAAGFAVIPAQYENAISFQGGVAPVSQNGLWGYIDVNGSELIAPQFSRADVFHEGFALVQKNGKWGFIADPSRTPSEWAVAEIDAARAQKLIPETLDGCYTSRITRAEFCRLAVHWLTVKSGRDAAELAAQDAELPSFTDTADPTVLTAARLGIVNGRGDGRFDPYGLITREEAATMLYRTARVLTPNVKAGSAASFTDSADFSSWAAEAIAYVASTADQNGKVIMGGTGGSRFDAKGFYTREQSFLTMIRLYTA